MSHILRGVKPLSRLPPIQFSELYPAVIPGQAARTNVVAVRTAIKLLTHLPQRAHDVVHGRKSKSSTTAHLVKDLNHRSTLTGFQILVQSHAEPSDVLLALGPEGGWSDDELKLFQEAGWISASLGNTILRSETAAIASLAVVLAELRA